MWIYISLIGFIHFTLYTSQVTFSLPKVYTFQLDFISNILSIVLSKVAMIGIDSNALLLANSFFPLTKLVLDFCLFNSLLVRPILSTGFYPEPVDTNPFEMVNNCLSGGDRLKVGLIFKSN